MRTATQGHPAVTEVIRQLDQTKSNKDIFAQISRARAHVFESIFFRVIRVIFSFFFTNFVSYRVKEHKEQKS